MAADPTRPPLDPLEALRAKAEATLGFGKPSADRSVEASLILHEELLQQNEELRAAQRDNRRHSALYRLLFDALPMAAFVVDGEGRMRDFNVQARDWLQTDGAVPLRDDPYRLLNALIRPERSRLQAALRRQDNRFERKALRLQVAAGESRRVDLLMVRLPSDGAVETGYLILLTDRTREHAAHIDQQLLQSLLDSSQAYIYAVDTDGRLLVANQALIQAVGKRRDEVVGMKREQFFPLRDCLEYAQHDQQVIRTGQPIQIQEVRHIGVERQVFESHKFPLFDENRQVVAVGGISLDVTGSVEAQQWQRISEMVFQRSREAIMVTDEKGCIIRVNPAFTLMSGFSEQAVIGRRMSLLHSGVQDQAFYEGMWADIRREGFWQGELVNRTATGESFVVWASINALRDDKGKLIGYMSVETDVTELHNVRKALLSQATTDHLTGLPNRAMYLERLEHHIQLAKRSRLPFAVLFADLDHFKEVNDTQGHDVGDDLLRQIARRLRDALREQDMVARLGGDEFVALLPGTDREQAERLARRLLTILRAPLALQNHQGYEPQASVGLAMYPDDGETAEELMSKADQAMYAAKRAGRNQQQFFDSALDQRSRELFNLHVDLRVALTQDQLRVFWQPKFRLDTMALVGAEALVRWAHPVNGLLGPRSFLHVAEQYQMIREIDRWVLKQSLLQVSRWRDQGRWPADWRLSVNMDANHFMAGDWMAHLEGALTDARLDPQCLEVELTETVCAYSTPESLAGLSQLRELGVRLSIDDFGTGYSNLAYLKTLPASVLKIDQSFVRGMSEQEDDLVLIRTMIELGQKLGFDVLAEGVETEQHRRTLMQIGCQLGQGYLLSPPVSGEEFERRFLPSVA